MSAAARAGAAGLARAAAGIHRLAIPTPFAVGRVNAYLIEDAPLTLIDSGPNSAKALDELEQQLARLGYRVEQLELLLITHQHLDHIGLSGVLARRSGAAVAALDRLVPYLADYSSAAELDDRYGAQMMRVHGVPEQVVDALLAVSAAFRGWGSSVVVTRPLHDGEPLSLRDRTLIALHRPGHSPSDTVLWDERGELLIAGDHLIGHISSNPLISRPLSDARALSGAALELDATRARSLLIYLDSLRRTRELPARLTLPGHGEAIEDHVALIDERIGLHERRAQRILEIIRTRPRSAYEIAQELWGNVPVTEAYLMVSEIVGHIDLLVERGLVTGHEAAGVVRFAGG